MGPRCQRCMCSNRARTQRAAASAFSRDAMLASLSSALAWVLVPLSLPLGGVKGSLVEASSAAETGEMGWVTGLGTGLVWPAPLRRACQACQGKAGLDWVALACLVGPFEVLGLCSNQSYQYS